MNRERRNPGFIQLLGESVRAMLSPREYEHLKPRAVFDHMHQQIALQAFIDQTYMLLDQGWARAVACHFNPRRIAEQAIRERGNLHRKRGGEQQILSPLR